MGWSSGSGLYDVVIEQLLKHVPDEAARKEAHLALIPAFQDQDWDTEDECEGKDPAFDAALEQITQGHLAQLASWPIIPNTRLPEEPEAT